MHLSDGSRPTWMSLWRSSVVNTRSSVKNSFWVGGTPTFSWSLDSEPYGLVVGTLRAPNYALFVSHNHPEGHVSTTYHPSRLLFLIIPGAFQVLRKKVDLGVFLPLTQNMRVPVPISIYQINRYGNQPVRSLLYVEAPGTRFLYLVWGLNQMV